MKISLKSWFWSVMRAPSAIPERMPVFASSSRSGCSTSWQPRAKTPAAAIVAAMNRYTDCVENVDTNAPPKMGPSVNAILLQNTIRPFRRWRPVSVAMR